MQLTRSDHSRWRPSQLILVFARHQKLRRGVPGLGVVFAALCIAASAQFACSPAFFLEIVNLTGVDIRVQIPYEEACSASPGAACLLRHPREFVVVTPSTKWAYSCLLYTSPSPRDS